MSDSYKSKMDATNRHLSSKYLKKVVDQPTQQSSVKAKVDKASPTGISEDKRK